ncbi:MAG: caspase family protein [Thermoanaerobaculia bacterium]|nr:caspase family protein [Thermoanaerobaculia bacterium]
MNRRQRSSHYRLLRPFILLIALTLAAPTVPTTYGAEADEGARTADDLVVVDCLLPQKVRRLGRSSTFLAPRQPIRTTAVDCRIRGGEYTEPDQASYATALEVWLPKAKGGDAEAQFYVGQIFERGLGTTADYESAALWYRRAAEQDHTPSQVALGYLYEQGLGVAADEEEALRWYRRAGGLTEDLVVMQADRLESLQAELQSKKEEAELLQTQVETLRKQLRESRKETEESEASHTAMESLLGDLEARLKQAEAAAAATANRVAELQSLPPEAGSLAPATSADAVLNSLSKLMEGENHALIIGNGKYQKLPELQGATEDAKAVADVLQDRYGFRVRLLLDADRFQILSALNELRESLASKDRLVVYYTGHGHRQHEGRNAWWQPIDADPKNPVNWIPSALVSEHLDLMAPNHVLLLANAVFGGLRTRSSVARLPQGMTAEERVSHVRRLLERRTRLVLSAADATGQPDSAFNDALVEALRSTDGVLEASRLYEKVNETLYAQRGDASNVDFATLRWARNDLSDFFFVPPTNS